MPLTIWCEQRGLNISQQVPRLGRLLCTHVFFFFSIYTHIYSSTILFVQSGVFLAFPLRLALRSRCCRTAVTLRRRRLHSHSVHAVSCSGGLGRRRAAFGSCHLVLPTVVFGSGSECSSHGGDERSRDAGCTRSDSFRLSKC